MDTTKLIHLFNRGLSLPQICDRMGETPHRVSAELRRHGLGRESPGGREAHMTAAEELSQKRRALERALLDDAAKLRERLWQPSRVHTFQGGVYIDEELPEPTHADKLKLIQAVSTALSTARDLNMQEGGARVETVNLILSTARELGLDDA